MVPLSEPAFLFYKGKVPEITNTSWFSDKQLTNASSVWCVQPSQEDRSSATYYRQFSWEVAGLIWCMSKPIQHRSFVCNFQMSTSMLQFCKINFIKGYFFVPNEENAMKILDVYNLGGKL